MHTLGLQTVMNLVDLGTVLEMEREVGPCGLVARPQQSQTVSSFSRFQVAPVISLPNQAHAQARVKANGTIDAENLD